MGNREQTLTLLQELMQTGLVWGVKAEFEAEGTRTHEFAELVSIAKEARAKVAVKIGGPEAVRDLLEVEPLGVDVVIAPMCESGYAVEKFAGAVKKVFGKSQSQPKFLVNFETVNTWKSREEVVKAAAARDEVDGIVFGRVDYSLSSGLGREAINDNQVLEAVRWVAANCHRTRLELVVGGGVSPLALPFLRKVQEDGLTRFETRKVVFHANSLQSDDLSAALQLASRWEVQLLESKRSRNVGISREDDARIAMLRERWL